MYCTVYKHKLNQQPPIMYSNIMEALNDNAGSNATFDDANSKDEQFQLDIKMFLVPSL